MALALAVFSVNVAAIPIDTVGDYDEVYDSVNQGTVELPDSSSTHEEAWIESVLGRDIVYSQNDGTSGGLYWEQVTGVGAVAGDYAFYLGAGEAGYYLIKIGGGAGAGAEYTHYLFENNDSMQWAFLNLRVFGPDVSLTNIDIISHTGIVPEPGIVGLLAIGVLGIVIARRKKII